MKTHPSIDIEAAKSHWRRLLSLARSHGVQVHRVAARGLAWKGLYLYCAGQSAVALRDGLAIEQEVWVLAHELGHHFNPPARGLFPPFLDVDVAADRPLPSSRRRRRRRPDEDAANRWAAEYLITEQDWRRAVADSPVDLHEVAAKLGLPSDAAVAWQRAKLWDKGPTSPIIVPVGKRVIESLNGSTDGVGGHQALFRRVLADCGTDRLRLRVTYGDFLFARERVCVCRGGWRDYYSALLSALKQPVLQAGGGEAFFGPTSVGIRDEQTANATQRGLHTSNGGRRTKVE